MARIPASLPNAMIIKTFRRVKSEDVWERPPCQVEEGYPEVQDKPESGIDPDPIAVKKAA